ncbi:hypothetical protein ABPH35_08125 [Streptococcus sp. ZJ93]|uniref:hypothetical protein n=1 Tax=Streptococcus handemini TaxID=3161188 RepID=UPI0032EEC924
MVEKFKKFFEKNIGVHFLTILGMNAVIIFLLWFIPSACVPYKRYVFLGANLLIIWVFWLASWANKSKSQLPETDDILLKDFYKQKYKKENVAFLKGLVCWSTGVLFVLNFCIIVFDSNSRHYSFSNWLLLQLIMLLIIDMGVVFWNSVLRGIYDISYDTYPKDKKYWLRVWNYLNYRDEAEKLKKEKKYLGYISVVLKNRDSITTDDVVRVKKSLKDIDIDELLILSKMKLIPAYSSMMELSVQRIRSFNLKYLFGGTVLLSVFNTVGTKIDFNSILEQLTFQQISYLVFIIIILLILLYFLYASIENVLSSKRKRSQIEPLLYALIDEEIERRVEKVVRR